MFAPLFAISILIASTDAINIVSSSAWGAAPAKFINNMNTQATHVVVHHTSTPSCSGTGCYSRLRLIQQDHFIRRYGDIAYNFLIGQDGTIFEGQGFGRKAAHAIGVNSFSIGISIIGDFENIVPSQSSLDSLNNLISHAVAQNYLRSTYKLIGHRAVKATDCPGQKLFNLISKMRNFSTTK